VRFDIVILQDQRWQQAARRWRRADEHGFDHAWIYDHLGRRNLVDGPWFDAVPTLTAAAGSFGVEDMPAVLGLDAATADRHLAERAR
jgi:hypothetical protein